MDDGSRKTVDAAHLQEACGRGSDIEWSSALSQAQLIQTAVEFEQLCKQHCDSVRDTRVMYKAVTPLCRQRVTAHATEHLETTLALSSEFGDLNQTNTHSVMAVDLLSQGWSAKIERRNQELMELEMRRMSSVIQQRKS